MTTDKTPATLAVDVLAVMRQCANVATCNSQRYGGPTLKQHAEEANAARAAVAQLIEALEKLFGADMEHCMEMDGKEDQLEAVQFAKAALARVKGESA